MKIKQDEEEQKNREQLAIKTAKVNVKDSVKEASVEGEDIEMGLLRAAEDKEDLVGASPEEAKDDAMAMVKSASEGQDMEEKKKERESIHKIEDEKLRK